MMKKITSIMAIIFVLCFLFMIPAGAKSYQTYTYSLDGFALHSPDAYVPQDPIIDSDYMGLTGEDFDGKKDALYNKLSVPADLEVDDAGNVYIADAGDDKAGRIIVLDRYYKLKFIIHDFINDQGNPDELANPRGVFITEDTIFVCDTGKNRIVTFDRDGNFESIIKRPESELFEATDDYQPIAMAVDQFDRLYVVSSSTDKGVIVMTRDGEFTGFIGAQKNSMSVWDIIWRRFQSEEQREQSAQNLTTGFNNITITEDGFIYATTDLIDEKDQMSAMKRGNKKGDYSPVKMLNAAGEEIMRRNGFWPPAGEVAVFTSTTEGDKTPTGASKIVDVAIGPEKTWSIIDQKRSKVYTYDFDGNLLFIFGDSGEQLGNVNVLGGIVYQEEKMLLLDTQRNCFTIFRRTDYGDILINAIENQNNRRFDMAYEDWNKILQRNSNYDAAYIGIGQSLYREGDYEGAIEKFKAAYDTANYDRAYKDLRKEWIEDWILLIPVGIIAICVAWLLFMKYCNKVNSRAAVAGGKRNFKEEFLYAFHVIFHPFDGFWDLKHEKRGSLRASIVYIIITVFVFFYQAVGSGYAVEQQTIYTTIVDQAISVLVPLFLWAVSNWCLTCLFDGEGSFKDIMTAMGYTLIPLILTIVPTTIASNFVTASEVSILNLITTIGFIWTGMLIFFGMMVTHDYTIGKNALTTVGTIVAMVFIMFVGILFTQLLGKVVSFITNIVTEINYRS